MVAEKFADGLDVAEAEFVEPGDFCGDHAVRAGGAALVKHEVHAVSVGSIEGQRVVEVAALHENLALVWREENGVETKGVLGRKRRGESGTISRCLRRNGVAPAERWRSLAP